MVAIALGVGAGEGLAPPHNPNPGTMEQSRGPVTNPGRSSWKIQVKWCSRLFLHPSPALGLLPECRGVSGVYPGKPRMGLRLTEPGDLRIRQTPAVQVTSNNYQNRLGVKILSPQQGPLSLPHRQPSGIRRAAAKKSEIRFPGPARGKDTGPKRTISRPFSLLSSPALWPYTRSPAGGSSGTGGWCR